MAILISLLGSIFSGLVAWLVTFISRKVVVIGITLGSFLVLTVAFVAAIKFMVLAVLALAVIPAWLTEAVGMFLPYNFAIVLANILAAQSCRWAYDKAIEKLNFMNSAT